MQRKYLSDNNPDYKCLENYLAGGHFGKLPDLESHKRLHNSDNMVSLLKKVKESNLGYNISTEKHNEINARISEIILPTRFDSPLSYQLIDLYVEQLKRTAHEYGIDTKNFPHYATVPTGMVNAQAVTLPCSSRPFLLFDGQLLLFCHLISKIYAACLTSNEISDISNAIDLETIKSNISKRPEIATRLSGVLDAFIKTGNTATSAPFPVDFNSKEYAGAFAKGMELFIVAHEFGHVYAGHLSNLCSRLHIVTPSKPVSNQHKQEYEADSIALILTVSTLNKVGYDLALSISGIKLFFSTLDLAARYSEFMLGRSAKKFSSKESETHPSNENRKKSIDDLIDNMGVPPNELNKSKLFTKMIDDITNCLWEAVSSKKHKPGRNDLCNCGSGKKFKKCCESRTV